MKRPSVYVKMKALGAIDVAPGKTRHERIHHVAAMTFLDEEGQPHRFTWRTIQTWYYRCKTTIDIELLMTQGYDFLPAVSILENWLEQYGQDLGQAKRHA